MSIDKNDILIEAGILVIGALLSIATYCDHYSIKERIKSLTQSEACEKFQEQQDADLLLFGWAGATSDKDLEKKCKGK